MALAAKLLFDRDWLVVDDVEDVSLTDTGALDELLPTATVLH